jgi:Domain of unknown function (DUF4760)
MKDVREKEEDMVATYEDAALVVQLLRYDVESGVDEALSVIFSDSFEGEKSAPDDANIRKVLMFGESVGALVKHNVLDRDLIRDIYWFDGIWSRVKFHALAARAEENEPSLYENFELLVSKS